MHSEVEDYIRKNVLWSKIPTNVTQNWVISSKDYDKQVVQFSIRNQKRHKGNIVCTIKKDGKQYYQELLMYSSQSLMLYPYHLSDVIVTGLRVTPFQYYSSMMEKIMSQERSYDSLPNFTAADCVRLLGIGRNEYIELMNQCRSGRKMFKRRNPKELLPNQPVDINIEPWWNVLLGLVTEDDIKFISVDEKEIIDKIIDNGKQKAGCLNFNLLHKLYKKGLVYLEVPIEEKDYIVVPPLEGFVMNRVLGDYFETLLYKIFVSIDEHTTVEELSEVLEIDLESVKNAVSLYCRLGFAKKKQICDSDLSELHSTWDRSPLLRRQGSVTSVTDPLLLELDEALAEAGISPMQDLSSPDHDVTNLLASPSRTKRIAFLFDSTLTAFLMMGNLSPGLKSHAVTMFEVGKLPDESLDSLLTELEKISMDDSEGEAQRYFDHALILRSTIMFLRQNESMMDHACALDLIRCESLQSLDAATCSRLLNKNYSLLVSMAPLSKEIRPICSKKPPHLGPPTPEVNTVWFKLFIYYLTSSGPPSILLAKGTRLKTLPKLLRCYEKLLVTTWGHDPTVLSVNNLVFTVNEALCHSAVLVQACSDQSNSTVLVPFPFSPDVEWSKHPSIEKLSKTIDLRHNCGFLTMVNLNNSKQDVNNSVKTWIDDCCAVSPVNGMTSQESVDILQQELDFLNNDCVDNYSLLDCDFGVPLFDAKTNKSVCQAICDHKLWSQESINELITTNEKVCVKLLTFIFKLQEDESLDDEAVTCNTTAVPSTLLPRKCLVYNNGNITRWDGK